MDFKIAILGGGPGGYVAALRAAQLGASVCVIENDNVGGTCLNWGCIPTKTLLASAEVLHKVRNGSDFGVTVGEVSPDLNAIMERKQNVVERLRGGTEHLLEKRGVAIVRGTGTLTDKNTIAVSLADGGTQSVTAENIILATGSRPLVPPVFNYDGERIITSNEALNLTELPDEIIVIGGSVVGCEFATIFNALGAKVTVVEMLPKLLATEDDEVIKRFTLTMKKKKIKVLTGTRIESFIRTGDTVQAVLDNGKELTAGMALVAIGRALNTGNIGLDTVGITAERGVVPVDGHLETPVKGIYAIGDITGKMLLAHLASKQGIVAVENIMGTAKAMDYRVVPRCVFTLPEVASVGVTERDAAEAGLEPRTGKFMFAACGKALALGETDGFVKIVTDKDDTVIGGHIIGPHASDLIMELALAVKLKAKAADIADTIHLHPSLAESVMEAAEDVAGHSIHQL